MTHAIDTHNPRTIADLLARRAELERLLVEVETEIVAVEDGLRVAGLMPAGRPRKRPTHTPAEAREAHARHQAGESSDWIDEGERQYKRRYARRLRSVTE